MQLEELLASMCVPVVFRLAVLQLPMQDSRPMGTSQHSLGRPEWQLAMFGDSFHDFAKIVRLFFPPAYFSIITLIVIKLREGEEGERQ